VTFQHIVQIAAVIGTSKKRSVFALSISMQLHHDPADATWLQLFNQVVRVKNQYPDAQCTHLT
jgi:hypothetical protein